MASAKRTSREELVQQRADIIARIDKLHFREYTDPLKRDEAAACKREIELLEAELERIESVLRLQNQAR